MREPLWDVLITYPFLNDDDWRIVKQSFRAYRVMFGPTEAGNTCNNIMHNFHMGQWENWIICILLAMRTFLFLPAFVGSSDVISSVVLIPAGSQKVLGEAEVDLVLEAGAAVEGLVFVYQLRSFPSLDGCWSTRPTQAPPARLTIDRRAQAILSNR